MSDTDAYAPAELDREPGAASRRRLLLVIGGAVAAVVLLALGYVLFLSGGGSDDEALGPVVQGSGPRPVASPSTKPGTLPASFNDKIGRNPFQPLAAEAVIAPAPTEAPSPQPTTTIPTQPIPTVAPTAPVAPPPAPTPTPTSKPTKQPTKYQVTVSRVDQRALTATLLVNGVEYRNVSKGTALPKGQTVQVQVTNVYVDPSGRYVQMRLGSGAVETAKVGQTVTFDFSA